MNEELIVKYIVACTNLYGVVPIEKVVEIYNSQNEEVILLNEAEGLLQSKQVQEQLDECFVYIDLGEFVAEATSEEAEKHALKQAAAGKPYYVPHKEELLRYMDEEYFQETTEQMMVKNMLKEDSYDPADIDEDVAELVYNLQVSGGDFMMELSLFLAGLELLVKDQQRYIPVIVDVADTTRLWENRGHTMKELQQQ